MAWRERPSLSAAEARQLHAQALVIDSQQPPVTSGFLFTERMRNQLEAWREEGMSRADVALTVLAAQDSSTSKTICDGPIRRRFRPTSSVRSEPVFRAARLTSTRMFATSTSKLIQPDSPP